jgi:hypothetical protein
MLGADQRVVRLRWRRQLAAVDALVALLVVVTTTRHG